MARNRILALIAALGLTPVAALALSACGDDSGGSSSAAPSSPQTSDGQSATIGLGNTSLGDVLVDSQARTIYLFGLDTGTTSECTGACAVQWPPVVASSTTPTTGSGLDASLTGTTMRSDGTLQVTYNGHPLYDYIGDQKAGDTSGEGLNVFGGVWYALDASGNQVTGSSSSAVGASGY